MADTSSLSLDLTFLTDTGAELKFQTPLSEFTTFRLGGLCPCVITCRTPDQLLSVIKKLPSKNIDYVLFGGGSNLLVSDEGLDCVVIRFVRETPIIELKGHDILVSGSTALDQLVAFAVGHGLEGINYCSGIPGTVGGAIVGNAGAFGNQVGDVLKTVVLADHKGNTREAKPESLGFRYRHSDLKETEDIVVSAVFQADTGNKEQLSKEREEILALRHSKHPDLNIEPSAGSFFRNIEPTSKAEKRQAAGWFLEQAGAKELRVGGARIFEKHANIIVKDSGCKAQDVFELSKLMAQAAKKHFDLTLVREVRLVGKFQGMPTEVTRVMW